MDELLELMNSGPTSTVVPDHDSSTEGEEHERKNVVSSARNRDRTNAPGRNIQKARKNKARSRPDQPSHQHETENLAKASVDDRLDIRMTNRLVSSNDLSELITDYDYHPPAVLSAMTLKSLNSLLQVPSQIIDAATVAGRTENLVTIGIVFTNSGTRLSSKGGAFCVLTIGNLNSGPCLTIFLFGEAYGKYSVSCKPGKVIALMAPKLLPADRGDGGGGSKSQNSDRTVSFSVYDAGQLKIVANARDYATCKESECKNYVDKRKSEYCQYHLRQLRSRGGKQPLNKFQQLRSVHVQGRSALVDSTARKGNAMASTSSQKNNIIVSSSSKKANRFLNQVATNTQMGNQSAKGTKSGVANTSSSSMRFGVQNVPKHMTKNTSNQTPRNMYKHSSFVRVAQNSSAKRDAAINGDNSTTTKSAKRSKNNSSGGDFFKEALLNPKKGGPATTSNRRGRSLLSFTKQIKHVAKTSSNNAVTPNTKIRPINTGGSGLDGSVVIPQPSKLFQNTTAIHEAPRRAVTPKDDSKRKAEIYQQQAETAKRLRENKPMRVEKSNTNSFLSRSRMKLSHSKRPASVRSTAKSKEVDDFLASIGDFDEEKVRNAKSKFANEVEAEEYAKRRRRVDELEKAEKSHEIRNKKKKSEQSKITKKWLCHDCGKYYFKNPTACKAARHNVKTVREIENGVTKDDERHELNKKSAEDGGLRLGAGMNWIDRYPFSN